MRNLGKDIFNGSPKRGNRGDNCHKLFTASVLRKCGAGIIYGPSRKPISRKAQDSSAGLESHSKLPFESKASPTRETHHKTMAIEDSSVDQKQVKSRSKVEHKVDQKQVKK